MRSEHLDRINRVNNIYKNEHKYMTPITMVVRKADSDSTIIRFEGFEVSSSSSPMEKFKIIIVVKQIEVNRIMIQTKKLTCSNFNGAIQNVRVTTIESEKIPLTNLTEIDIRAIYEKIDRLSKDLKV